MSRAIFALILGLLAAPSSPGFAAEILLDFGESSVSASGATAGGDVLFFYVGRRPMGTHERVEVIHEVAAADVTGTAELSLDEVVALRSTWGVVDLVSGDHALGSPPGFALREDPFRSDAFLVGEGGLLDRVQHRRFLLEATLVRPGASGKALIWTLRAADGAERDADGEADGVLTIATQDFASVMGDYGPPAEFLTGDLLMTIDPDRLSISVERLEAGTSGGGER